MERWRLRQEESHSLREKTCYWCGDEGHFAFDCPKNKDNERGTNVLCVEGEG